MKYKTFLLTILLLNSPIIGHANEVTIDLTWQSQYADLDLHIFNFQKAVCDWSHDQTNWGCSYTADIRGEDENQETTSYVEQASIDLTRPPSPDEPYTIVAYYYDWQNDNSPENVQASVDLHYRGQLLDTFLIDLNKPSAQQIMIWPTNVISQVSGYVRDELNNPLAEVLVTINGKETTTDEKGYYQIDGLEAGSYILKAIKDGHHFASQEITIDEENPKVQLTLVDTPIKIEPPRPTLCFVIDDTGSMRDEINGIRDSLIAEIESQRKNKSTPYSCLLTFKDQDEIHLRISSPHLDALLTAVNRLEADGGDDCAEDSVVALNQVADFIAPGGTLFLATDAPPHEGYQELTILIDKLRQQKLTIEILLTEAYCVDKESTRKKKRKGSEHFERSVAAYSRIVREVGNGSSLNIIQRKDQGSDAWLQNYRRKASNLITSATQPTITALLPTQAPSGSTLDLELTATGAPFNQSELENIQIGGHIIVNSSTVLSPDRLVINVTIPKETVLGHYDMTIHHHGQSEPVLGMDVLEIIEAPESPTILSITPTREVRDQSAIPLLIYGLNTHFNQSDSQLSFGDNNIIVRHLKVHSDTLLEAKIDIRYTAQLGLHNITVTTGDEIAKEDQIGPFLVLDIPSKTVVVPTPTTKLPLCADLGNPITERCDNEEQILYNRHITSKGAVVRGEIGGQVTNEGWVSNIKILASGQLTGGLVTGYIMNDGLIANIEFVGAVLSEGQLAGTITVNSDSNLNLGILKNVTLLPDTLINGGQLTGQINGPTNGKAKLNAAKIYDAQLTNLVIGADCELGENVQLGAGIIESKF